MKSLNILTAFIVIIALFITSLSSVVCCCQDNCSHCEAAKKNQTLAKQKILRSGECCPNNYIDGKYYYSTDGGKCRSVNISMPAFVDFKNFSISEFNNILSIHSFEAVNNYSHGIYGYSLPARSSPVLLTSMSFLC